MAQGILPFQYEMETPSSKLTSLAGLALLLDFLVATGLLVSIRKRLRIQAEKAVYSDEMIILAIILLNVVGGDRVEDIDRLERDPGIHAFLMKIETYGMKRKAARAHRHKREKLRMKEEKAGRCQRALPGRTTIRKYLAAFHLPAEESKRIVGKAFIPAQSEHLQAFRHFTVYLLAFVQRRSPQRIATLDMDATLVKSTKREAFFCYKHFPAFQPFQCYWAEQGLLVQSEFRDGNVNAGLDQLRVLVESLEMLPEGVEQVFVRSDTAGYQWDFLKYCAKGENKRFGVIPFAVGADVTPEFRKAVARVPEEDWTPLTRFVNGKPVATKKEYAEVCFVPTKSATSKNGPEYRFLATREPFERQESLPGMEKKETKKAKAKEAVQLPFPTMDFGKDEKKRRYKLFGIVTNRYELSGQEVVEWLYQRCGKSEEVHAVLKDDLAGGILPASEFGANAAWWAIVAMSFNLISAFKQLVLGPTWVNARMKRLRFAVLQLPGRVVFKARQLFIRVPNECALQWLLTLRQRIGLLAQHPPPTRA